VSQILKRVLSNQTNFSFNPRSVILAKLNRAELGDFDAHVLGLFFMAHFKGHVVVPKGLGLFGVNRWTINGNSEQDAPRRLEQAWANRVSNGGTAVTWNQRMLGYK